MAKTNSMHAKLISQFFLRQVDKSYIALVYNPGQEGNPPRSSGVIDLPVGGRPATSHYTVVAADGQLAATKSTTMLRIRTQQGRKHQVRIHCSKGLQRPVLLDPLYGGERIMYTVDSQHMKQARANKQFCLHADQLFLPELKVRVTAPVPLWWNQIQREVSMKK
jgi:23S rRNA-/tRNA-specific pseudouridylate synthase